MKILHIIASPHAGGAEIMCLNLATEQASLGHSVQIFCFSDGVAAKLALEKGLDVIIAKNSEKTESKSTFRAKISKKLTEIANNSRPDVVHSHVPISNLICNKTLPPLGVKWVTTIHGSWKQFAYSSQAEKKPYLKPYLLLRHAIGDYWTTRTACRIIAISDYVKQELTKIAIPESRITRIHNGLPCLSGDVLDRNSAREKYAIDSTAFVIGSAGFFAPVKGFDLLILAFSELTKRIPEQSVRLLIAGGNVMGDTITRENLKKLIENRKLTHNIQLLEEKQGLSPFFQALDLFVVSSRTEGFSLVLAEAMQHGLASVVTSAGGCSEAARDNEESLAFQSENIQNMADAIEKLIKNNSLRNELGDNAKIRATGYLTIRRCAEEYLQVYQDIQ